LILILFLVSAAQTARVEARLLNIGGSLTVNYSRADSFSYTDFARVNSTVTSLGQQYQVGLFGDFSRLGNYRADVIWLEQDVHLPDADQRNRYNVTDYRLNVGLFPMWSPLSLNREQIIRRNDLEIGNISYTLKDRIDTFGGNWVINMARMPRVVANYQESKLNADSGNNFLTRAATVYTDTTVGVTQISAGYQFSQTDATTSGTTTSNGVNLDTNSQLSAGMSLLLYGRYTSSHLPNTAIPTQLTTGVPSPGVSFFQERSFGATAIYRPPLYWWDGMLNYNFTENPYFNDFKSQSVQGAANMRFNEKTDSNVSARYLQYIITNSTINTESADATINYRPIFGLTTGLNGNAGLTSTQTTGTPNTENVFQHYQYNIDYTRPWQLIQYRADYQVSYGVSDTTPTGFNSRDLGNTVTFGLDNTNIDFVHLSLNALFSDIQRITDEVKTEQTSYNVQLLGDSAYFRNVMLLGDSLGLRGAVTYSDSTGFGIDGKVTTGEAGANYQTIIGLNASAGYRIDNYPTSLRLDRQMFIGQIQYTTYLIANINITAGARGSLEDNRYRSDIGVMEGDFTLNYVIGKLTLTAEFQQIETITSGDQYGTRAITAQATRPF